MDPSLISRFSKLFAGYELFHGTYTLGERTAKGKVDGTAATRRGPADFVAWEAHLEGERGLGVIPLRQSLGVCWAAIDIDSYSLDLAALARRLKDDKLVVFRTKSGGAHVVAFFAEEVSADLAIDFCRRWSAILGHAKAEVFPKQTTRINDADIGNWLNMPYFKAEQTMRYALNTSGNALSFADAIDFCEGRKISATDVVNFLESNGQSKKSTGDKNDLLYEAPPCLRTIRDQGGFPEGTRNIGMFAVAVYLRKRYGDEWRSHLDEYNLLLCDPPIEDRELNATVGRSIERKEYAYPCKQSPIVNYCDKKACLRQRYGVGTSGDGDVGVEIENITKIEGNPIRWIVSIGGRRVFMTTEELDSPAMFRRKCMDELTIVPVGASGARWQKYLAEKMSEAEVIPPVADDVESEEGIVKQVIKNFLFSSARATRRNEVKMMLPYHENTFIYVSPLALIEHVKINLPQFKMTTSRDLSRTIAMTCSIEKKKMRVNADEIMHVWQFKAEDFQDINDDDVI